jgi:hypothetical protein
VTTLASARASLNAEIGVLTDADTVPWTPAVRNDAIGKGYAALWGKNARKPVIVDLPTVDNQETYAATGIRALDYAEVLDSSGYLISNPAVRLEPDGVGGYRVRITGLSSGLTLRLHGRTAYKSVFSGDSDTDDLEAEWARVPLLKAKAILYRQALGQFARFNERQVAPPTMSVSVSELLTVIAAAEREWEVEVKEMSRQATARGQSVRRTI